MWGTRSVGHQESENHGDDSALSHAIEEGRPSRWKDGLTRSFMHHSPIDDWKGGSKLLAKGVLGPRLRIGLLSPRAPRAVLVERRLA